MCVEVSYLPLVRSRLLFRVSLFNYIVFSRIYLCSGHPVFTTAFEYDLFEVPRPASAIIRVCLGANPRARKDGRLSTFGRTARFGITSTLAIWTLYSVINLEPIKGRSYIPFGVREGVLGNVVNVRFQFRLRPHSRSLTHTPLLILAHLSSTSAEVPVAHLDNLRHPALSSLSSERSQRPRQLRSLRASLSSPKHRRLSNISPFLNPPALLSSSPLGALEGIADCC